jgi:secondary thiamine-phosphate synthase enzyme
MIRLEVDTHRKEEIIDITNLVQAAVARTGADEGMCFLNIPHTTAALTVNSVKDPATGEDILDALDQIAPIRRAWKHIGNPADAEAHVKATLVGLFLALPIEEGALRIGPNQSVLLCEFDGPRKRQLDVTILSGHTSEQ